MENSCEYIEQAAEDNRHRVVLQLGGWHAYTYFYGEGNTTYVLGTVFFFLHKTIISAVKRVEFVSDRMSYIILRGR
jgi:hypothetical protein